MAIRVSWGHMEPRSLGKGRSYGSMMTPFERAMVVFCRLSIVTVALSITIRPHLQSNVSDAQINMGWVTLGQNFPWSRPPNVWVYTLQRSNIPG